MNGKGSRFRPQDPDKWENAPYWANLKKDIKETLCSAGQLRGKRCKPCVCKKEDDK